MADPLLEVRGLATRLRGAGGLAVDGASFTLERGGALGVVGESGCGKTLLALSVMRLLPPGGEIVSGQVLLDGVDLVGLPERAMRAVRGKRLAMVFQEPLGSLNPVFPVGAQIAEALREHQRLGRAAARAEAVRALRAVGIADPERQVDAYPHQLSGGMRQRAMIALALACGADALLADEPTTALDATVQAQIVALLRRLRLEKGLALLFISHDLPLVARICDELLVMYAGRVVERGPAAGLLAAPAHPYTAALCRAVPGGRPRPPGAPRSPLATLPGRVPAEAERPPGCAFAPRCSRAAPECSRASPPLRPTGPGREVACLRPLAPGEGSSP